MSPARSIPWATSRSSTPSWPWRTWNPWRRPWIAPPEQSKTGDKKILARKELLERVRERLDTGQPVRAMGLEPEDLLELRDIFLLTAKPTMYIANVAEDGFQDNPFLDAVHAWAAAEGAEVVPVCAAIEAEIVELEPEETCPLLADLGLDEPGLNRVVRAGYRLLGLETYFTAGPKEVRAWTIPRNAPRPSGRRRHPHRFRARLHPRRGHWLRRLHRLQG